jgi:two-component system LytT family sensor kinase
MKKDWYKNKKLRILFHILAWVIFLFLPHLLRPEIIVAGRIIRPPLLVFDNLVRDVIVIAVFYLNAYWIIPMLMAKRKTALAIFSLLLTLSVTFISTFVNRRPPLMGMQREMRVPGGTHSRIHGQFREPPLIPNFFVVVFVLALSTTYRFILDKVKQDSLEQQRRTEHLKTELSFLRSQISPHFIFNILNSAVSLSRTGSDLLEPTLLKLSSLMRYMLYGADDEKVPLAQEVNYLESYIDLQKLRFGDDVPVEFIKSNVLFGYGIEPMLLIPFVENAFKHGVGDVENPEIKIELIVEQGELNFNVSNKFNALRKDLKDTPSGIGLNNVKKRLNLLYGAKHSLQVEQANGFFITKLKLMLK